MKTAKSILDKRGSYLVEASIIIPIVLVAVMTVAAMCKVYSVSEKIVFKGVDEGRLSMINSYILGDDITLPSRLRERLKNEKHIKAVTVSDFKSGFKSMSQDSLISYKVSYGVNTSLPLPLITDLTKNRKFVCRKFIGANKTKDVFSFERMEEDEEGIMVNIFPYDGEKYHSSRCSYVEPKSIMTILSDDVRRKYEACESCDSDKCSNGENIYVFPDYGNSYHKKNCSTVKKKTSCISLASARDKGYTACSKCGGKN